MPSEWTNVGNISDGMLADYEVLNNLMNNDIYLKNSAVGVTVTPKPGGPTYNETNIAGGGIRFIAGVIPFSFNAAQLEPSRGFSSTNRPLVFATVHETSNATVSVKKALTTGATFTIKRTGTGTVTGYIAWLAIVTQT